MKFSYSCIEDHMCGYATEAGFFTSPQACVLKEGAIGGDCTRMIQECERENQKTKWEEMTHHIVLMGTHFIPLTQLSATAGISMQVVSRLSGSSCGSGQCRTRTGRCCQLVYLKERYICPIYC